MGDGSGGGDLKEGGDLMEGGVLSEGEYSGGVLGSISGDGGALRLNIWAGGDWGGGERGEGGRCTGFSW